MSELLGNECSGQNIAITIMAVLIVCCLSSTIAVGVGTWFGAKRKYDKCLPSDG